MKLGSLCTGYGGLDLAAEAVLGPLEHAWHAEIDPHASQVLAHHWPTTPNLGDLTAVDWTRVEPVDVLTAGYPCQPLSLAGRRAGLTDERWIWDDVIRAVRDLRPRLVLLENVAGHLSLGFGRVLGDLASAGFDAEWGCFRASDVGAPHRRERVFIAAWPSDCPPNAGDLAGRVGVGGAAADGVTLLSTPRASDTGTPGRRASEGFRPPLSEVLLTKLLPTPRTSDTNGGGAHGTGGLDLRTAVSLLPTPTVADSRGSRNATAGRNATKPSTHSDGWTLSDVAYAGKLLPTPRATDGTKGGPNQRGSSGDLMLPSAVQPERWGDYAPAITRWEAVTGRQAPSPTEPGKNGQPRLAPPFVEWLMGLPAGWVTDHLGRNPALKALGNGVVWQQAAHAYTELLAAA